MQNSSLDTSASLGLLKELFAFWFCNHLAEEESAGRYTLSVVLMSSDSWCAVAFPYGAVGCGTAVNDCDISWLHVCDKNRHLIYVSLIKMYCIYIKNKFDFWNFHGIMNISGLLQSKWRPKASR